MATGDPDHFEVVTYGDLNKSVTEFLNQGKLWKWVPSHLSNRIVAQQSVFVFGEGEITESVQNYKSVKINGGSKKNILEELEKRCGITEQYLFSDFTGFALSNAHDKPYNDYTAEDHFSLGLKFQQERRPRKGDKSLRQGYSTQSPTPKPKEAYNNRGNAKGRNLATIRAPSPTTTRPSRSTHNSPKRTTIEEMPRRESGNHQGAIADYNEAIKINPQFGSKRTTIEEMPFS